MDLSSFMKTTLKRVVREEFGDGDNRFTVELRMCSRSDLERMRKASMTKVLDRKTKQYRDEPDLDKLRAYLRDHCVTGWEALTYGKAASLCNRTLSDDQQEFGEKPVDFTGANVQILLEEALGFEDWVWERVTQIAELTEELDSRERPSS